MKKKVISTILAVCMVLALGACGSSASDEGKSDAESSEQSTGQSTDLLSQKDDKRESMTVIVDGKEYDLTGDFQQVVGKMVKDGLNPISTGTINLTGYDEKGKLYKLSIQDLPQTNLFYVNETSILDAIENCPIVVDSYMFGSRNEESATFETADNITQESDDHDLEMLEDIVPVNQFMLGYGDNDVVYMALYADGEKVDLQIYRDAYDEFVKEAEESDVGSAIKNRFNMKYIYRGISFINSSTWYDGNMSIEELEEKYSHFRETIMFYSAVQEKVEALEAEEIESVDIVRYTYKYSAETDSSSMLVDYYHHYVDENWNKNKFY